MLSSRRVLFVEQDESLQRLVHHLLAREGISVDSASASGESISLLAQHRYDVILLDVVDNNLAAHEVIRALALIAVAKRPVVLAVAEPNADPPLDPEVVSLIIRKPYDLPTVTDVLITCVGAHVGGRAEPAATKEQTS